MAFNAFVDASAINSVRVAGDASVASVAANGYAVASLLEGEFDSCSNEHISLRLRSKCRMLSRTSQTPLLRTNARGRNRNTFRAALRRLMPSLVCGMPLTDC